jgi:hypothetical protein
MTFQAGDAASCSANDRHDAIARELFHEQVPQIGLHRIQRKTGNPKLAIERGTTSLRSARREQQTEIASEVEVWRRLCRGGRQLIDGLKARVGTPNSKPHFMVARWTIVNADVRIYFSRQRVGACNVHFCSASTCGQFSAARN